MLNPQIGKVFRAIYSRLGKDLQARFWRVMGLSVLVALTEFVLTAAVSLLGVVLASPQTIAQSGVMHRLVAFYPPLRPITEDPRLLLIVLLTGLCGAVLCKSLALALLTWRQASFSQAVNLEMGQRLFHGFVHAPYLWHVEQRVSDLSMALSWRNSVGLYGFAVVQALGQLAVAALLIMVVLVVTPLAGSVVLAGTALCSYVMFRLSRKLVDKYSQELTAAQRDSNRVSHTALYGVRELMIYRQQAPFEAHYLQHEGRVAHAQALLPLCHPLPSWVLEWMGMVLLLGAVVLLYWQGAAVRHKAAELLFVSEFSRQEFLRLVGRPRGGATVTPNGVDASWLECPLVDAPTQPPYFLAVGNIKPHKNIRLLCHTFAGIAGQCTANLVLAGAYTGFRSAETSTEALAAICPGRIHFTGALEQTELVHLMRGATALVFPSRYEGFGLPPLEALAVGVPVVASDIPPVREVCGTHAQYFSPDSEGQLAQAMLQVLALPPQERRQHAAAGRAHAHTFSWARAAETTAQVLQKTLHL